MTATSRAFDLAQYVGEAPINLNDATVVASIGPPFTTKFTPIVTSPIAGTSVGATMPAPTGPNQILVSNAGLGWSLQTNPALSASVPPPKGQYHVILADGTPSWQDSTLANMLGIGGAVLVNAASVMQPEASLTFLTTPTLTTCIDGTDPTLSAINNFSIDCGTF